MLIGMPLSMFVDTCDLGPWIATRLLCQGSVSSENGYAGYFIFEHNINRLGV